MRLWCFAEKSVPMPTPTVLFESVPAWVFRSNDVRVGKSGIRTDDQDRFSQDSSMALEYWTNASSRRKDKSQMSEADKREASYILAIRKLRFLDCKRKRRFCGQLRRVSIAMERADLTG